MIFNGAENREHKTNRFKHWHKWFAWHPVRVGVDEDGYNIYVWLEYVARRGRKELTFDGAYWAWEYRILGHNDIKDSSDTSG